MSNVRCDSIFAYEKVCLNLHVFCKLRYFGNLSVLQSALVLRAFVVPNTKIFNLHDFCERVCLLDLFDQTCVSICMTFVSLCVCWT